MQIQDLARRTGLLAKTIRYYESAGVLPPPKRRPNGYREYSEADVERVRLAAGARRLGLSLDDITEILAMRDRGEAPCRVLLDVIARETEQIQQRIAELERLEKELRELYELGLKFPMDDVDGKDCLCHLVSGPVVLEEAADPHSSQN